MSFLFMVVLVSSSFETLAPAIAGAVPRFGDKPAVKKLSQKLAFSAEIAGAPTSHFIVCLYPEQLIPLCKHALRFAHLVLLVVQTLCKRLWNRRRAARFSCSKSARKRRRDARVPRSIPYIGAKSRSVSQTERAGNGDFS